MWGPAGKAQSGSSAVKLLVRFYFGGAGLLQLVFTAKEGQTLSLRGLPLLITWKRVYHRVNHFHILLGIASPSNPSPFALLTDFCLHLAYGLALLTVLFFTAIFHLLAQWPNARTPSFSPGSKNGSTRPENVIRRASQHTRKPTTR